MTESPRIFVATWCTVVALVACGGGEKHEPGDAMTPPPAVTSRTVIGEMPPDHPPVGTANPGTVPAPPMGSGTGATEMVWDVPDDWIEEQPSSYMRRAQYRVPGPGGDSEFVVFYFGPGQGGDPMLNAARWAGQFRQPDGRSSTEAMSTAEIDVSGLPVLLAEVTGTYANLMVNDTEMPGYMLLGAIAPGPDANWFFKLTGPESSVRSQREAFEIVVRSIRTGVP